MEELARDIAATELGKIEVMYDIRRAAEAMRAGPSLSGFASRPREAAERRVATSVLKGAPRKLRLHLVILSLFPPIPERGSKVAAAAETVASLVAALSATTANAMNPPPWFRRKLGEIRAGVDEREPLVTTCVKLLLAERDHERRGRLRGGGADDRGDLPVDETQGEEQKPKTPWRRLRKGPADGDSRAHAACLAALAGAGADVDLMDGVGRAPLHHACARGDAGVARFCVGRLQANINLKTTCSLGETPLHIACGVADRRRATRCVVALLEMGCNARLVDLRDSNALHVAAPLGPRSLVELLLEADCGGRRKDCFGMTPADRALKAGQRGIAEFVRTHRDPVRTVGGPLGVGKRLEFVESGQIASALALVGQQKSESRNVASLLARQGKRKLRKAAGKTTKAAKKYAKGMARKMGVKIATPPKKEVIEFPTAPKTPEFPGASPPKPEPPKKEVMDEAAAFRNARDKKRRAQAKKARAKARRASEMGLAEPAPAPAPAPEPEPEPEPEDPSAVDRRRRAARKARKAALAIKRLKERRKELSARKLALNKASPEKLRIPPLDVPQ